MTYIAMPAGVNLPPATAAAPAVVSAAAPLS
jgi:hypothetical protein